jgi:hypothetical protein
VIQNQGFYLFIFYMVLYFFLLLHNSRVSYVAKKALVRLRTFGQFNYVYLYILGWKKIKKYMEAPKLKMAAQVKMTAKI